METSAPARTFVCIVVAAVACLAALCGSAAAHRSPKAVPRIAPGHRSGPGLQPIEERRAVARKHHRQRARRARRNRRRRRAARRRGARETGVPTPAAETGDDSRLSAAIGPSTPVSDSGGEGTAPADAPPPANEAPVVVETPPVTETPAPVETPPVVETPAPVETPPVTETPPPTTPPAEPPPPPAGPAGTHCFASPHLCGFPDASNTGVPAGVTLTPSGSLTITRAGTVVSGLQVTGTINVMADNVTIEDTRVTQNTTCGTQTTCGNYAIRIDEAASATTIRHVETLSAPGDTCEHDIRDTGGTVTIEGSYLHACDSNVYAVGPTVLKDSYGIAKIAIADDHVENIYFNETGFTAIHDTLLNPVEQTAVIFGNSGGGSDVTNCSNQLTVLESLIGGGGYTLYPCAHASQAGTSSLNVQGNHFVRCVTAETYDPNGGSHPCVGGPDSSGYYANSGSYGIAAYYFDGVGTWRGNVWDDNLAKVCIDGRSSGCE